MRGPGVANWDFGLFREFAVRERGYKELDAIGPALEPRLRKILAKGVADLEAARTGSPA